jgi:peptidoglycan/LPS O-acetylase OafA/YrhL
MWATATTPLLAGGVLVCAEGVFLAIARRRTERPERQRRLGWLVGVGLGGIAVSAVVLLAASFDVGRSLAMTIAGTLAGVGVIALLRVRSPRDDSDAFSERGETGRRRDGPAG